MARGLVGLMPPRRASSYAARGVWILDSGASDFLVGAANLSKRELTDSNNYGPAVLLSTANGSVEKSARSRQKLPNT
eukprot:9421934-Heterocapsa_arctica.AAC.1